jgi:hypothetical protein
MSPTFFTEKLDDTGTEKKSVATPELAPALLRSAALGCVGTKRQRATKAQPVFLSHSSDDPSLAFGFITSLLLPAVLTGPPSGLLFIITLAL